MIPTSPTHGDLEEFLKADGWAEVTHGGSRQRYIFFEKVLAGDRLLRTHISHDRGKTMSAGVFSQILKEQLEVSRQEFWETIRNGEPVSRPVETDEIEVFEHPAWVVNVLVGEMHMSAADLAELSTEDAERLVHEHWGRPKH